MREPAIWVRWNITPRRCTRYATIHMTELQRLLGDRTPILSAEEMEMLEGMKSGD